MKIGTIAAAVVLSAASAGFSTPAFAAPASIDIRIGPPAPRYEAVPAARRGHVWVPGHWDWRGNRHHWVKGTWVRERAGYYYNAPNWVQQGDRWQYNRGAWVRGQRDRDRDGVPNRNDRDRDGDGVRNRNDSRPDNPRRQ